jgi:hypothetical protein
MRKLEIKIGKKSLASMIPVLILIASFFLFQLKNVYATCTGTNVFTCTATCNGDFQCQSYGEECPYCCQTSCDPRPCDQIPDEYCTTCTGCSLASTTSTSTSTSSSTTSTSTTTTTIPSQKPTYSDNSTSSTSAGTYVEFGLKWNDDTGLSGFIFSFDNCTGTLTNDTWQSFPKGGLEDWSKVIKLINSTVDCTIKWKVYANDTNNLWNSSEIFNFTTSRFAATQYPFQRKTFYANGRYWVFYANETDYLYISSTNGVTWSFPKSIRDEANMYTSTTTRYFTSWSKTVNNKTEDWLTANNSEEFSQRWKSTSESSADFGIKVYMRNVTGYEFLLTSSPMAIVTCNGNCDESKSATWTSPDVTFNTSADSIKVEVLWRLPSGTGTWESVVNFTTKQLEAMKLVSSVWNVTYEVTLTADLVVSFSYGEANIIKSGIENFTIVPLTPAGYKFSVWFNGTYVSYALSSDYSGASVIYRRGLPNSDGTITWDNEQIAYQSSDRPRFPTVTVDSQGYPYIGFGLGTSYPYLTKSSFNNGTWSTASGFPKQLSTTSDSQRLNVVTVLPLNSSKIYAVYTNANLSTLRGRLWNGTNLLAEKEISSFSLNSPHAYSAIAKEDNVHLVFLNKTTYQILYVNGTYNSTWQNYTFGQPKVVVQGNSTSFPVLSSSDAYLYAFWAGTPQINHIYYKRYSNGEWDSSSTDWKTETALTSNDTLSGFYEDYENKVGLVWMNSITGPYQIRFDYVRLLGWLNVTLYNPPPNQETQWYLNKFYFVNVSAQCKDGFCPNVKGVARYNLTLSPDTSMSFTQGAEPFYAKGLIRPLNYSVYTSYFGSHCTYSSVNNPEYAYDGFYNDTSTYVELYTGTCLVGVAHAEYTFYLGLAMSANLFITTSHSGASGWIVIYNFTSASWMTWFTTLTSISTNDTIISRSNGLISSSGYSLVRTWVTLPDTAPQRMYVYDIHAIIENSTLPCEDLDPDENCNLAWQVEVTGKEAYKIDVNFTSSDSSILPSDTQDATVTIVYLEVTLTNPSTSFIKKVVQNSTFSVNTSVTCKGGNCGTVNATVRYNTSSANPDTAINNTDGATPFYIVGPYQMLPTYAKNNTADVTNKVNASDNIWGVEYCDGSGCHTPYIYINFTTSSTYENVTVEGWGDGNQNFECWSGSTWVSTGITVSVDEQIMTGSLASCSNSDGNYTFRTRGHAVNPFTDANIALDYVFLSSSVGASLKSCGSLSKDQSCQLNWTVNATGNINTYWKIDVNFNSSDPQISSSDTYDATIKIVLTPKVRVEGTALYYYTGERVNGNVTVIPVESPNDKDTSVVLNGEWSVNFNMETGNLQYITIIVDDNQKIGYNEIKIDNPVATSLSCSIQDISLSGYSIYLDSGNFINSGKVKVSVLDTDYTNTTNFTGTWDIDFHPCLIPGKIYTLQILIFDDTGKKGEFFQKYPAR